MWRKELFKKILSEKHHFSTSCTCSKLRYCRYLPRIKTHGQITEATPETQQKPYSRADKLASACLWFLRAAMPGQNVLQVSVCCWSTRGQPNNDELLWVTQKRPILKMLLPNLADSPCWDCCSVCAGPPFYWYRLIPTELWSPKKCLLQLMPAFATTERKRQKQGRLPDRHM